MIGVLHHALGFSSLTTMLLTVGLVLVLAWLLRRFVEPPLIPRIRALLTAPR